MWRCVQTQRGGCWGSECYVADIVVRPVSNAGQERPCNLRPSWPAGRPPQGRGRLQAAARLGPIAKNLKLCCPEEGKELRRSGVMWCAQLAPPFLHREGHLGRNQDAALEVKLQPHTSTRTTTQRLFLHLPTDLGLVLVQEEPVSVGSVE